MNLEDSSENSQQIDINNIGQSNLGWPTPLKFVSPLEWGSERSHFETKAYCEVEHSKENRFTMEISILAFDFKEVEQLENSIYKNPIQVVLDRMFNVPILIGSGVVYIGPTQYQINKDYKYSEIRIDYNRAKLFNFDSTVINKFKLTEMLKPASSVVANEKKPIANLYYSNGDKIGEMKSISVEENPNWANDMFDLLGLKRRNLGFGIVDYKEKESKEPTSELDHFIKKWKKRVSKILLPHIYEKEVTQTPKDLPEEESVKIKFKKKEVWEGTSEAEAREEWRKANTVVNFICSCRHPDVVEVIDGNGQIIDRLTESFFREIQSSSVLRGVTLQEAYLQTKINI